MRRNKAIPLTAALVLSPLAVAQTALPAVPSLPHARTMDLLVTDQTFDGVWRLVDRNQDGDYHDVGEVIAYYDETIGSVALATPGAIATNSVGTVLVADLGSDLILAMRDGNGDGDAHDAGEHAVWFDNTNLSGVQMFSVQAICIDVLDRVFVVNGDNASGGIDAVYLLQDLNGDGDAQDAGEALEYCAIPNAGGSISHSNPFELIIGPDFNLYYYDGGSNGPIVKGVYKLEDLDFDGDCNDAGEVSLFWQPTSIGSNPFVASFAVDSQGYFYLAEHGADEVVWRGKDLNANGVIEPSEESVFYQSVPATWWDIAVDDQDRLYLMEGPSADRVTVLEDLNANGVIEVGEERPAYDDDLAANDLVRPRAGTFLRAPLLDLLPPVVQAGNSTAFVVRTEKPFDLGAVFLSVGLAGAPIPLPPFGTIEIDPSNFVAVGFGLSDASAQFSLPFAIPNIPTALGTYGAQALCGDDFRLFLTDGELLTVTP